MDLGPDGGELAEQPVELLWPGQQGLMDGHGQPRIDRPQVIHRLGELEPGCHSGQQQHIDVDEWIMEVGGGLNFERKQFLRLVDAIIDGQIERVILAHQDRLARFGYKLLNVVTGNAPAGKEFFEQHCANCHSPEKDLAHIAKRYEPADLQAQFLYPAGTKNAERTVVVHYADGRTDSGTLVAIDDFTVTIRDANSKTRVIDRQNASVDIHDPLSGHRDLLPLYTNTDMHNVLAYLETLQ